MKEFTAQSTLDHQSQPKRDQKRLRGSRNDQETDLILLRSDQKEYQWQCAQNDCVSVGQLGEAYLWTGTDFRAV